MAKSTQKCPSGNTVPRGRAFAFTSFKTDPPKFDEEKMKYLCYGKETCPTTGKQHWQAWVYWWHAKTISASAKNLENAHCELIKGSFVQNDAYCQKEGDYKEFGKKPNQGARGDAEDLVNNILQEKVTVDEICIENPQAYHMLRRTLERAEDILLRTKYRTEMTTCDWIWGPTGVGKSHLAFQNYNPETHYIYRQDNGWWEGYKGQHTVIINDFRGEIRYNDLLQLIDKWPHHVRRRNREPVPFLTKHIIITSSLAPDQCYHNRLSEDRIEQLLRRINVIHLTKRECSPD